MSAILPHSGDESGSIFDVLGHNLRFGVTDDDRIYVVASDIAKAMGYRDAANATRTLDEDEKGTRLVSTPGGDQHVYVIYEDGIWELIFRSSLPGAKLIKKRVKDKEEIDVFVQAVENAKPLIEVRSKRVGGATYQVPMQVKSNRQQTLAFRWIIGAARDKKGRPMHLKLADELVAAYNREGAAMEKRETVHKMADANKAFAHFAW